MSENHKKETTLNIAKEVEELRKYLHLLVDEKCDTLLQEIISEEPVPRKEILCSLSTPSHTLIGRKPVAVIYPNGDRVEVSSWRRLVAEVLSSCTQDPIYHQRLMNLCNRVYGNQRKLLSNYPDGMDSPIKFDENMYFEGHFGTEMLLKVLIDKILRPIGYDYSTVKVEIRNNRNLELSQKIVPNEFDNISLKEKILSVSKRVKEPISAFNTKIKESEPIR